jgi:hypothetical protein
MLEKEEADEAGDEAPKEVVDVKHVISLCLIGANGCMKYRTGRDLFLSPSIHQSVAYKSIMIQVPL